MLRCTPQRLMYLATFLSSWGDRMWSFAVGVFLVVDTPGSIFIPAIYGLVASLSIIVLGAAIGKWIDRTPRLKAAQTALGVQNASVTVCCLLLVLSMTKMDDAVEQRVSMNDTKPGIIDQTADGVSWKKLILQILVIITANIASLANLACDIVMDKDWIVVLAEGNSDKLSRMNSIFRSMDLLTLMLSPMVIGLLMSLVSKVVAALFIAGWNIVSFGAELVLIRKIHRLCPQLAAKSPATRAESCIEIGFDAWKLYFLSDFCFAGLALAFLYLTVLGFDNITTAYGLFQGISAAVLSTIAAVSALIGVCGAFSYTTFRRKLGIKATGLIGFSLAVLCQSPSFISIFLPGTSFAPFANSAGSITSVATLFGGVVSARFGLWISDLSVTQLLQETVEERWRGAFSGVQCSLNMLFETIKFVLAITMPGNDQFGYLVICSYLSWTAGLALFCVYLCRVKSEQSTQLEENSNIGLTTINGEPRRFSTGIAGATPSPPRVGWTVCPGNLHRAASTSERVSQ